jgi:hypothetical protein
VAAGDRLGVPPEDVEVRLVAHHYVSHRLLRYGDPGAAAMALAVLVEGRDVSSEVDVSGLLKRLPIDYRRTGGVAGQAMTAASALSVLEPLADGRPALVHAPGPLGLPGGYPVALSPEGIRLVLPDRLTEREAVEVNLSGQVRDGITRIDADGTVHFEPSAVDVMRRELGYDCARMPLAEAEGRAAELGERFARYRGAVAA